MRPRRARPRTGRARSWHQPSCALCLIALLASGCVAGGDEAAIDSSELRSLVLQPSDLEGDWLRFDEGRQASADAPTGPRADPERFGREGGWKARYKAPTGARGALVVESRADVFEDEDGAIEDFALLRDEAEDGRLQGGFGERVTVPQIGEETVATTLEQGATRYYLVAWRQDNATASVLVNGFARSLRPGDAVALARAQQRRLVSAG